MIQHKQNKMYYKKNKKVDTPKTCKICNQNNIERQEYRKHILNKHLLCKDKEFNCQHCEKKFQDPFEDFKHYKIEHTTRPKEEIKVKNVLTEKNVKYEYQYGINNTHDVKNPKREAFFIFIDFKIERDDTFIFLEVDENQHKNRNKREENNRMEIMNKKFCG